MRRRGGGVDAAGLSIRLHVAIALWMVSGTPAPVQKLWRIDPGNLTICYTPDYLAPMSRRATLSAYYYRTLK
jgi:hypothetical protein